MTLSEYFRTCGGCLFHITIKKNGIAKGVTEPKGEIVGNEEIQACFTQAGLKPEKGTYSFTLYAEGTRLDTAPSGAHCIMANSLEVAVDARITRPMLARILGAQSSTLPSDSASRGDAPMQGEGMHGQGA